MSARNVRFAKAQPTVSDVHVNRPLTDLSVAFMQSDEDFVATRVFPMVPVQKQSDLYFVYERADWFRSNAQRRAPGTESAGSGWNLSTDSYFAHKYAIHKDVSDDIRSNADQAIRIDQDATQYVTQQCMLIREITWVEDYFVTGVWTNESTPGTLWDAGGSTPIEDIRAEIINVKGATGFKPNVIVLSPRVWAVLQDHPDFVARVNAGQTPGGPALFNLAAFAAVLEIDEAMIAWGVQNSAAEGATEATDFIAGDNLLLAYRSPAPSLLQPSAGYTFAWTGLLGAGAFGNRIKRFRIERIESDRVECELAFDTKVVSADLAHLFLQPIS